MRDSSRSSGKGEARLQEGDVRPVAKKTRFMQPREARTAAALVPLVKVST